MAITWILFSLFLPIMFGEIIILGRYISIRYSIFKNKFYINYFMGFISYFALAFIFIFPFSWLSLNIFYYMVLFVSKDIFIIIYIFARRDILNKAKFDLSEYIILFGSIGIILIVWNFGIKNIFTINQKTSSVLDIWGKTKDLLSNVVFSKDASFYNYLLQPIVAGVLYSSVVGLFQTFSKRNTYLDKIISLVISLLFLFLFNFNMSLVDLTWLFLLIGMILQLYNLFLFSRRRYGSLFAMIILNIFFINSDLYWTTAIASIGFIVLYIIKNKPKPFLFVVQILVPLLIFLGLKIEEISRITTILIGIFGFFVYLVTIGFENSSLLNKELKYPKISKYIFIVFVSLLIFIPSLIIMADQGNLEQHFFKNNSILGIETPPIWLIIQNVFYYLIFISIGVYLFVNKYYMKMNIQFSFLLNILLFMMIFCFNPITSYLIAYFDGNNLYHYGEAIITISLMITLSSIVRKKIF